MIPSDLYIYFGEKIEELAQKAEGLSEEILFYAGDDEIEESGCASDLYDIAKQIRKINTFK